MDPTDPYEILRWMIEDELNKSQCGCIGYLFNYIDWENFKMKMEEKRIKVSIIEEEK